MDDSFEKKASDFQYKVQQKLNLANDEIDRLKLHYSLIQGEITEVSDRLNKINVLVPQAKLIRDGKTRRNEISTNTMILTMKKDFDLKIQQIQKKHSEDVAKLNADFSKTLNEIEQHAEALANKETSTIYEQIDKTKQSYNEILYSTNNSSNNYSYHSSFNDIDQYYPSTDEMREKHEKENQRIAKLQKMIKRKNDERLQCILNGKTKLQECVEMLDQMEEEHTNQMNYYTMKITNMDSIFQNRVDRDNEKHQNTLNTLNEKQKKYDAKIAMIQNTIEKVQQHHKEQINDALKEGEHFQSQNSINKSTVTQEIKSKDYQSKLDQLYLKLQSLENDLVTARTENDSLKRELNRLKHEEKMQSRINAWKNHA